MYDLTIDDFPPDRLTDIVHWRNDPVVNRYLRQGILTLEEVQAWCAQYFSRAEHKLFAVYADKTLIGYGTLSHIDPTHRSCEIGIVIETVARLLDHVYPPRARWKVWVV